MQDLLTKRRPEPPRFLDLPGTGRDRRFEALYMRSYNEMRSRNAKD